MLRYAGAASMLLHGGATPPVAISAAATQSGNPLDDIIQRRGLTPDEAEAALKTFVPPGKYDDFVMMTSGGHRGTIMLYGIPSMRLSYGDGLPTQTWGDLHHPQISLTNGKYDGEWMIGTDKSAGRVAIVSMKDFKTRTSTRSRTRRPIITACSRTTASPSS